MNLLFAYRQKMCPAEDERLCFLKDDSGGWLKED